MSRNAPDGDDADTSNSRPQSNQGSTPVRTPRKQQKSSQQRLHTFQTPLHADESPTPTPSPSSRRLYPGTGGRTATDPDDSECATPTPAPHRYGLRARRASRGLSNKNNNNNNNNNNNIQTRVRNRNRNNPNCTCSHNTRPPASIMASGGKWREEQILIICPGSRTTMAQLGCGELSPPAHRIPTRMFRDEEEPEQWRPYYTYKRTTVTDGVEREEWVEDVDEDKGAVWPIEGGRIVQMDAFLAFLDHVHGLLTTTYHNTPIMLMASPQWTRPDCETIARYIFEKTKTPALCLIHSGIATQYGLKWPNMTVVDIGYEKVDVTAIHDGRVVNHMDLGRPLPDRFISGGEVFTRKLLQLLEGQGFNHDMAEQLKKSGICEVLPYAPAKKELMDLPVESSPNASQSQPRSTAAPGTTAEEGAAPGSGAVDSTVAAAAEAASQHAPTTDEPAVEEDVAMEDNDGLDTNVDEDGVLDVASIVTSGQTKEFLAKKEKEKEKEKGKPGRKSNKDKDGDAAAQARPLRQPNSKKVRNTFSYEEIVMEEVPKEVPAPVSAPTQGAGGGGVEEVVATEKAAEPAAEKAAEPATEPAAQGTQAEEDSKAPAPAATETEAPVVKTEESKPNGDDNDNENGTESKPAADVANGEQGKAADADTGAKANADADASAKNGEPPELRPKRIRREIEVGLERFLFADRAEIDRIVSTIYRTIQGVEDMYMRPACWDNLVFVGNGSRLRGLKDNILQTLNARHLISPSTATMFTSELPSNVATPAGTGSQTPVGSFSGAPHQLASSGVNPLLQAATTASTLGVAGRDTIQVATGSTPMVGSEAAGPASGHHFHSQTPTSIRTIALPTYLSEWSKNGFEEAMFLGAQVAARIAFCLHSNMDAQAIEAQKSMSLSRVDYNEHGPKAIRTHSMLS
ncbi:Actin-like protein [Trichoderma ghanense]|uniref:Actin-like protein n=1 Tax=Trichoderma ghanense TaxID=65468 RepID=A0ABY2H522_9HYPO